MIRASSAKRRAAAGPGAERLQQDFDRHVAAEDRISGAIDHPRAAAGDLRSQFVSLGGDRGRVRVRGVVVGHGQLRVCGHSRTSV